MVRRIGICFWLLAVVLSAAAAAQPAREVGEQAKQKAREHFERGNELVAEGDQSAALAEFLLSRELLPTRGNTKNAAVLLGKLGRYDEALEMFESLRRDFDQLTADELADVESEIARLETRIGTLDLKTEAGATVLVDDRERGTTPLETPLAVAAGSHRLRIVKEGRVPFERRIDIAGQQTLVVDAPLVPIVAPATPAARPSPAAPAPVQRVPIPTASRLVPFVGLDVGALVSPGLGGELAARCEGSCTAPLPLGAGAFLAGGLSFPSGLDIGAEIGFLRLGAKYDEREDPIVPVGYAGKGRARDDITLTALTIGGTAALRTGKRVPLTFGFAAGVLAASVRDERTGNYTVTNLTDSSDVHSLAVHVEQTSRGWYAYAGPEARVGFAVSEKLEVSVGIELLFLFALSPPTWDSRSEDYSLDPVGITQFSGDTLSGNVVLIAMPGLGARYAF